MSNRGDMMRAVEELRWELGELGRRLDRLAAMIDESPEVGGLYREQVRARAATWSGGSDPEAG